MGTPAITISAVRRLVSELYPGGSVEWMTPLGIDEIAEVSASEKACGYGKPARVWVRDAEGQAHDLVLHTATANGFGHEHRADRAAEMLLAFDTFGRVPRQVEAVDVGALGPDGQLKSLRGQSEFYLLTRYAAGTRYVDDLRAMGARGGLVARDLDRADQLSSHLAAMHAEKLDDPQEWRRSIRDLVGGGEGIFGLIDAFPNDVPGVQLDSLLRIEELAVSWRTRLRNHEDRLRRIHGDFHPFNILFDDRNHLVTLDASRGSAGDPADDVVCLAMNYVFFGLEYKELWRTVFAPLWWRLWDRYLRLTGDRTILTVAPPYVAWRVLVMASPAWYPKVKAEDRRSLVDFAVKALEGDALDLEMVEEVFS